MSEQPDIAPPPLKTVGAIDIGSNAIRLAIAQILPDGSTEVLERLQRAVRLGQDTFRRGRLGARVMKAAISILRTYKGRLDFYQVRSLRAVATSAVREAANADTFLDRIYMATGIDVDVIDTSEESRLTVSAVHQAIAQAPALADKYALIADVGGGGSLLTLWRRGEILASHSLPLGSVRLQEVLATSREPQERAIDLLRHQIETVVAAAENSLDLPRIQTFVAVGGDARFAADQIGKPLEATELKEISVSEFDKFVKRCQKQTNEELARRFGLPFEDTETLNPALLVYQVLLHETRARKMLVSFVSMRDGLIRDLAREVSGAEDQVLTKGVMHTAIALAEKYRVDTTHALHVAGLAAQLFDALQDEHGLPQRYGLLLQVAAVLHEVGGFISTRAHHKHSYYVINHSEVFGLSREDIAITAHTARYHRRSRPKKTHIEYMMLPREQRMIVNKLAALLRIADALEANRAQLINDFRTHIDGEDMTLYAAGSTDLTLERRALAMNADMFEDIFGLRVHLEEA